MNTTTITIIHIMIIYLFINIFFLVLSSSPFISSNRHHYHRNSYPFFISISINSKNSINIFHIGIIISIILVFFLLPLSSSTTATTIIFSCRHHPHHCYVSFLLSIIIIVIVIKRKMHMLVHQLTQYYQQHWQLSTARNCFSHVIYAPKTTMYENIAKLLTYFAQISSVV